MKLEVASWDMAKRLVQEGIMVGKKKCKVELWGQTNRVTNKRKTGSFPSPPTQGVQNPPKRPWSGNSPGRGFRCYNCGEGGHLMAQCTKGHKCDKCGGWGHNARDCVRIQRELHFGRGKEKKNEQLSGRTQVDKGKGPATHRAPPPVPTKPTAPTGKQPPPKMGEFAIQTTPSYLSAKGWGEDETNSAW